MIRKLRAWTDESERAVSPVIGVILMVAITVILAAVIGSFVLGIGGDIEETPQVTLEVGDVSSADLNTSAESKSVFFIQHNGGDTLSGDDISLAVEANGSTSDISNALNTSELDGEISPGSKIVIKETGNTPSNVDPESELNVRVIHDPSGTLLLDTTVTVE